MSKTRAVVCLACQIELGTKKAFERHYDKTHGNKAQLKKDLRCPHCTKQHTNWYTFLEHVKGQTNNRCRKFTPGQSIPQKPTYEGLWRYADEENDDEPMEVDSDPAASDHSYEMKPTNSLTTLKCTKVSEVGVQVKLPNPNLTSKATLTDIDETAMTHLFNAENRLHGELKSLRAALEAKEVEEELLRKRFDDFKELETEMKTQLVQSKKSMDELDDKWRNELTDSRKIIDALKTDLDAAKSRETELRREFQVQMETCKSTFYDIEARLKNELKESEDANGKLKKDLEGANSRETLLKEEMKQSNNELATLRSELEAQTKRSDESLNKYKGMIEVNTQINEENQKYLEQIAMQEGEIGSLSNESNYLANENARVWAYYTPVLQANGMLINKLKEMNASSQLIQQYQASPLPPSDINGYNKKFRSREWKKDEKQALKLDNPCFGQWVERHHPMYRPIFIDGANIARLCGTGTHPPLDIRRILQCVKALKMHSGGNVFVVWKKKHENYPKLHEEDLPELEKLAGLRNAFITSKRVTKDFDDKDVFQSAYMTFGLVVSGDYFDDILFHNEPKFLAFGGDSLIQPRLSNSGSYSPNDITFFNYNGQFLEKDSPTWHFDELLYKRHERFANQLPRLF